MYTIEEKEQKESQLTQLRKAKAEAEFSCRYFSVESQENSALSGRSEFRKNSCFRVSQVLRFAGCCFSSTQRIPEGVSEEEYGAVFTVAIDMFIHVSWLNLMAIEILEPLRSVQILRLSSFNFYD